MKTTSLKALALGFLVLGLQARAFATCQLNAYVVSMEFPDNSFISTSDYVPFSSARITKSLIHAGFPVDKAILRGDSVFKALVRFKADPTIKRSTLNAEDDSDGRIFEIRHECKDEGRNSRKPLTYPHIVGYTIRVDSSRTIWLK